MYKLSYKMYLRQSIAHSNKLLLQHLCQITNYPTMPYLIAGELYSIIESRKAKDGLSDRQNFKEKETHCKSNF